MARPGTTYIFATPKPWNLDVFDRRRQALPGNWSICTSPDDLATMVAGLAPRYVFFPHWSHIVPESVLNATECVCFHMTDLPYGRGGSPLQNLIERGHADTVLTALRMTSVLDGGPVYAKRPLSLAGNAHRIYQRAAEISLDLIEWIAETEPAALPQEGPPTVFTRRTPEQSRLPESLEADKLYDHIRMLDAPGYPHAFMDHGPWRALFTAAERTEDGIAAQVRFVPRRPNQKD